MTVFYPAKILNWKQITTVINVMTTLFHCLLSCKDTKLKANHNLLVFLVRQNDTVFYPAKILNWKQITTHGQQVGYSAYCLLSCKDTKLKANHNLVSVPKRYLPTVFYPAKILNWKQITTHQFLKSPRVKLSFILQRY